MWIRGLEMTVHILDSSLIDGVGHCYEYDLAIYQELKRRKISCHIYANQNIKDNHRNILNGTPHFRFLFYKRFFQPSKIGNVLNVLLHNFHFFCDLNRIRTNEFGKNDLIFVHTIDVTQISALIFWYCVRMWSRHVKLAVLLRFDVPVSSFNSRLFEFKKLYRWSFRLLPEKIHKNVQIFSDSEELAKQYAQLIGQDVKVLPIPHLPEQKNCGRSNSAENCIFFFPGVARIDKGYHLIPDVIEALIKKKPQVRFIIQSKLNPALDTQLLMAKERLKKIGENVIVADDEIATELYYNYLESADCILLPYDAKTYAARTSGVFTEALAFGKSIVTTQGTWMAKQIDEMGIQFPFMEEQSVTSLISACQRYLDSKIFYDNESLRATSNWRSRHNPSRFVELLLAA